jgi:hypothetical protein
LLPGGIIIANCCFLLVLIAVFWCLLLALLL